MTFLNCCSERVTPPFNDGDSNPEPSLEGPGFVPNLISRPTCHGVPSRVLRP